MWTGREGDENKEATWEEYSDFYKNLYRSITVSEFDRPHKTIVYCNEQDIPSSEVNGCSDIPQINFLSQYYILTHQAEVKMPSGHIDQPKIEDNRDGTIRVQYDPREEGIHELELKYNGEHVKGSPYKFHVDSIASGSVTAYGLGLTQGITGEPCNFTISTKGAGAGGLNLAVEGPSKAEITYSDNKDGTVAATYLPTAPGEYKVSIRFGDKNIKGSPFLAKVTGDGKKRNQISVPSCTEILLSGDISDADLRTLNGSIQTPSGLEEPCFLKRMPSGNIGISFTPRQVGEHAISVKRQGKHIHNSPFKVNVSEQEVGDAKKVKVTGSTLEEGKTQVENTFSVDTRNAGHGGLSLSIEGPSKAEINCTDKPDGTLNISYKPTEPGFYMVNLKFADHHVTGSPFKVKVTGATSNRHRETIQQEINAVQLTEVGGECKLTFKMPGITSFDLAASITTPSLVTEDAEIQEIADGLYAVNFVPKELGVHTVSVRYTEMHIPGSPFQYTVGPFRDSGSHLVKAGGAGLERGEVGVPSEFNVWTREAGGGALAVSIEGPSKAKIDFKDRKDGSGNLVYTVTEAGVYRIGIKLNDRHIPDSPHKVFISPAMGDAHKLEVAQFPQGAVQPDTPALFLVRKNGAKGELDAKVIAPSNTENDCFIQAIDQEEYSVRFYPRENGIHSIHVKFNGVHITGSPFHVKVGKEIADPAYVQANGNGLKEAKTGQKSDFIIDTCNAGAGTMAVTADGPSKVAMDCTEIEEGYKVRYTPLLPGDYYMSIKYNNMHIVGSPFKIVCAGDNLCEEGAQETSSVIVETIPKYSKGSNKTASVLPNFKSDASKVTTKGMGLKKAFLGKQNQFTVGATDAGNLLVFSFGISSGWATINLLELQNGNSSISVEPLNQQQTSIFVSIMAVGAFVGNIMILPIGQVIGIKRTIHLFSIPIILGTMLTIWAKNVYYLYASRFLIGLVGGGVGVAVPAFVLEISNDNVRGALNSIWDPSCNLGGLISFLLGNYLHCVDQARMQLISPILFIIAAFFLPESPEFWTIKNNEMRANKSFHFYKGRTFVSNKRLSLGFHPVSQSENNETIKKSLEMEHTDNDDNGSANVVPFFNDFCTPYAKNALFVSFTTVTLSFLTGVFTIVGFSTVIFKETGSLLSEKHSAILVSVTLVTGNLIFLYVVERINRRTLYITSAILTMISYFLFAVYGYLWLKQPGFEWMPMLCFACIVLSSCMGLCPIPFIVAFEIFPKKIRQTSLSTVVSLFWIVLFVLGATFLTLMDEFGLFNFMLVLSFICSLNALFGYFFMPETRGKSYKDIEVMMTGWIDVLS